MERRHVVVVTFPTQGHINPCLQFAKKLINMGIRVTFVTSLYAHRRMAKATNQADGPTFIAFTDGHDDGYKPGDDANKFMTNVRDHGSVLLKDTIRAAAEEGHPVTYLIYSLLLPWVSEVARELHIPSALLWIQPATVLSIYYHYFNGFQNRIGTDSDDPSWRIRIPGAPLLAKCDLPSFIVPSISCSDAYSFALPAFKKQLDALDEETKPKVLINTFDALEPDALSAIDKYEMYAVGPLIPSAFLDGQDQSDKSFGGDLFERSDDSYIEWLNSKPDSSVVYISFGSLLRLQKSQLEEIAKALLDNGRPFLWVIRENEDMNQNEHEFSCLDDLKKQGKIVSWCSQLEVLTNPSLGCFVTHCGWNSTLESLSCGVPVVAFPHWTDQGTNAKLIEDVWKTGVRVRFNEHGTVESEEIRRCVEKVMDGGERSRELRENAKRWRRSTREATGKNGSSTNALKAFFQQI